MGLRFGNTEVPPRCAAVSREAAARRYVRADVAGFQAVIQTLEVVEYDAFAP